MKTEHMSWAVAPDRKDLVFVPGVAQPMRCGSAKRARLTAAAPLMLKACELFAEYDAVEHDDFETMVTAYAEAIKATRAAIAAATGESHE